MADLHYDAIEYGCCGDNLPLPEFDENGDSMSLKETQCILERPHGSERPRGNEKVELKEPEVKKDYRATMKSIKINRNSVDLFQKKH